MSEANKAAHTALPWAFLEPTFSDGSKYISRVVGADGNDIRVEWFTLSSGPEAQANAALIVRAVNSHADMLSIARRWAALDGGAWHAERYEQEKAELLADTVAAIAKAQA
jgi:hypothetical protein